MKLRAARGQVRRPLFRYLPSYLLMDIEDTKTCLQATGTAALDGLRTNAWDLSRRLPVEQNLGSD